jgi:hypothetical protein
MLLVWFGHLIDLPHNYIDIAIVISCRVFLVYIHTIVSFPRSQFNRVVNTSRGIAMPYIPWLCLETRIALVVQRRTSLCCSSLRTKAKCRWSRCMRMEQICMSGNRENMLDYMTMLLVISESFLLHHRDVNTTAKETM